MKAHTLHIAGSSVLHAISRPVSRSRVASLTPLIRAMRQQLIEQDGQGIAAPQLGVPLRLFALSAKRRQSSLPLVLINPRIVRASRAREADWESCLSVPDYGALVERPRSIEVAYDTLAGATVERVLRGNQARVFQHELDHLDGRLYTSRMFAPSFARLDHLETAEERAPFEALYHAWRLRHDDESSAEDEREE